MREIIVHSWCDLCWVNERAKVIGTKITAGVDGPMRELDLCPECKARLAEPLRALIAAVGKPIGSSNQPGQPKPQAPAQPIQQPRLGDEETNGEIACLWCPKTFSAMSGYNSHLRHHGFANVREAYGTTCPQCEHPFDSGFGLISHLRQRPHDGITTMAEAFSARNAIDPPSIVVGARIAAGRNVDPAVKARYFEILSQVSSPPVPAPRAEHPQDSFPELAAST